MKRNSLMGILLIGAMSLYSCSTTKLASKDDDVYFSNAKAGDAPVYVNNNQNYNNVPAQNRYNNYNDDDYYYYDSYSSRINRFGYFSPFNYYDDMYYGYSPYSYYNNYSLSPYYYGGFGLGLGLGSYYGYSPFGYSPYYGYGYSPFNYFGTGYGYGGGVWGIYSAGAYGGYGGLAGNSPRPYRGSGAPTNAMVNRTTNAIGYNGNYPINNQYPGRPASVTNNGRQAVNSTGYNNQNNNNYSRPTRNDAPQVYTPQVQSVSSSNSGGGMSSGGGSGAASNGGGARPVRP